MKIELNDDEVALLLRGMDVIVRMAHKAKAPLYSVQPFIDLIHKIDNQTTRSAQRVKENPNENQN